MKWYVVGPFRRDERNVWYFQPSGDVSSFQFHVINEETVAEPLDENSTRDLRVLHALLNPSTKVEAQRIKDFGVVVYGPYGTKEEAEGVRRLMQAAK